MDCIFCKIVKNEIDSMQLYEDDKVIVIMDIYPNADGHCLIIPKEHYNDLFDLPDDLLLHVQGVAKKLIPNIMEKLKITAITTLTNYGDSQAIKHFHYHLIPNHNYKKPSLEVKAVFEILKK